jgi:hypothetical protein
MKTATVKMIENRHTITAEIIWASDIEPEAGAMFNLHGRPVLIVRACRATPLVVGTNHWILEVAAVR